MPGVTQIRTEPAGPAPRAGAAGLVLAPFRGVRFDPERFSDLAAVTSPPYDVIDAEGLHDLEVADRHNVVRLILPRPDAAGPEGRYQHAARTLRGWLADGTLRRDRDPGLYAYEQRAGDVVQRGLLGALALRDPRERVVLPHEDTMPGPVIDRLELMRAAEANVEPIFLVYDGGGPASGLVDEVATQPPLFAATTTDGVGHRIWPVTAPDALALAAADLRERQALIGDGHHRYAAYRGLQRERHAAGHGAGPWDFGLALLVDARAYPPQVRPIHRVVTGLPLPRAAELAAVGFRRRSVTGGLAGGRAALQTAAAAGPAFLLVGDGPPVLLSEPDAALLDRHLPAERSRVWRSLDAAVLHEVLLPVLWGVPDDGGAVTYHHEESGALRAAHGNATAVLMNPTPVSAVLAVAAAGERMPRKSTSFGPKPRTGLVLRTFADG